MKAVIFDIGRVLLDFDYSIFSDAVSEYSPKTSQEILDILYSENQLLKRFETGRISEENFYKEFSQRADIELPVDKLKDMFISIFTDKDASHKLLIELSESYQIGILSDISPWHIPRISDTQLHNYIDAYALSFEVGNLKPHPSMYETIVSKLGLRPEECLFIDDKASNVLAAIDNGLHAIQFSEASDVDVIRQFLESTK